jgi:phosphoribosylformylglycinamidine cyclo-ligase
MPGFYSNDEYDLAGFAVGVVDKCKILPSENIQEGDGVVYLPSNGIHSNGFSLIRKIMDDSDLSYTHTAPFSRDKKTFGTH